MADTSTLGRTPAIRDANFAFLQCGGLGFSAEAPGELALALARRRPAVIQVKIDPTVLSTLRRDQFQPAAILP